MKRIIKTNNNFCQYVDTPLIPSDVNSYMISWNIGSGAVGASLKVSAKKSDGTVIEDVGEVDSKGMATYTLKNNMYAAEGELILRLTVVQNGEVLTDKELILEVAKAWDEAPIEGDDRVPALSTLIIQVNDTSSRVEAIQKNLIDVEAGAQVNVIETVKVNSTALEVNEKTVDVSVPTKLSELENDRNFVSDAEVDSKIQSAIGTVLGGAS